MAKKDEMTVVKPENNNGNPEFLLQMAITKGVDIAQLEKLMTLHERWQMGQSKKAFLKAISDFQGECPEIQKTKGVKFGNENQAKYKYADLGSITAQIKQLLSKCGLSYRWEFKEEADTIICSCVVSHLDGHSETTTMSAKADNSGGKNAIQSRGSSMTYLQRYTLIGALGISTADEDVDGAGTKKGAGDVPEETLNEMLRITDLDTLYAWGVDQKDYHKNPIFQEAYKKRKTELTPKA